MNQKISQLKILLFIAGASVMVLLAVWLFGSETLFKRTKSYIVFFHQSINGLEKGAPVKFKGVQVGRVKKILITFDEAEHQACIPVIIEVERSAIVAKSLAELEPGLHAKMNFLSFVTGLRFIELDYARGNAPLPLPHRHPKFAKYVEIPSVSSNFENLDAYIAKTFYRLSKVDFQGLSTRLESILTQVDEGVKAFDFKALSGDITSIVQQLKAFMLDERWESLQEQFQQTVHNAHALSQILVEGATPIVSQTHEVLGELHQTLIEAKQFIKHISGITSASSELFFEFEKTLQEIKDTAASVQALANYLEQNPESILSGKKPPPKRPKLH